MSKHGQQQVYGVICRRVNVLFTLVSNIYCVMFLVFFFLSDLCCQFLWIVFFFIAPSVFIKCLHRFRIIVHLQIDSLLYTTVYNLYIQHNANLFLLTSSARCLYLSELPYLLFHIKWAYTYFLYIPINTNSTKAIKLLQWCNG